MATVINVQGGFAEDFGKRRVRVRTAGDVFAARAEFDRDRSLGNQIARPRSQDVHA